MLTHAVKKFMEAGDQTTGVLNPRQAALYVGLKMEELAETLRAVSAKHLNTFGGMEIEHLADNIDKVGNDFKSGGFDFMLKTVDQVGVLDGAIDTAWVALGLAFSIGANVPAAVQEVAESNMSKLNPATGKMDKHPATGKVIKGVNFFRPNLAQFIVPAVESEGGLTD